MNPIFLRCLKLGLPLSINRFIAYFNNVIGVILISYLGSEILAASSLITAVQNFVFVILCAPLFVINAVFSRYYGARDYEQVGETYRAAVFIGIIIIALMFISFTLAPWVLTLSHQPQDMVDIVRQYCKVYVLATPAMVLTTLHQQLCTGVNKANTALAFSVISLTTFAPIAPLFIFGYGHYEGHGIKGFPMASFISSAVTALSSYVIIMRQDYFSRFKLFCYRLPSRQKIAEILKIGLPFSLQVGGEMFSFTLITIIIGWLGQEDLAVMQVGTQVTLMLVIPLFGITQATTVLVSQAVGENKKHEIKSITYQCMLIGCIVLLIAAVVLLLFPEHIIDLYIHSEDHGGQAMTKEIKILFKLVLISMSLDMVINVLTGAFRGMYDVTFPLILGLAMIYGVSLPLAYLFGYAYTLGPVGTSIAGIIARAIGSGILLARFRRMCS